MKDINRINWLNKHTIEEMHSIIEGACGDNTKGGYDSNKIDNILQKIEKRFNSAGSSLNKSDIATSYLTEIIKNRPFKVGNAKMAIACCETFLALNGHGEIIAVDDDMMEILIDAVEDGLTEDRISELIQSEIESDKKGMML